MSKIIFPDNFVWGAATASYQIEGAAYEDGKGESIWDRFSHTPGKVINGDTGDVACDHYHRYKQDIKMMKEMGLKGYRMSISWPRIFPEGKGKANQKGVDFYKSIIDELLENGIEPAVTLYHWDLPQALQDKGGWVNRDTCDYFAEYASYMYEALGDKAKKWITHNEPWCAAFLGYAEGVHAPGLKDYSLAVQASHNLLLSHAKAVQAYRQSNKNGKVGITLNMYPVYPKSQSPEDKAAAALRDGYGNRWFIDPVLKGEYPKDMLEFYQKKLNSPVIQPGDMELISGNLIDFLGVNYYSRAVMKKSDKDPLFNYEEIHPEGSDYTDMNWEIYPQGLYDLLTRINKEYNSPHIYITENGAAFKDVLSSDGTVNDFDRLDYLKKHFYEAYRAIQDGVKLDGYYVWSLMDNFEWALGYTKRFGLVYVDFATQKRILKKSAYWYKDVIKNNGF